MNIFVSNLPQGITSAKLEQIFLTHGKVLSAKVIVDHKTGQSRGFGFVKMAVDSDAKGAIEKIHGSEIDGRIISAKKAQSDSYKTSYKAQSFVPPRSFHPPKAMTYRAAFKDYD